MKYLVATFTALLLLGCESSEQKSPEKSEAAAVQSVEKEAAEAPVTAEEAKPAEEAKSAETPLEAATTEEAEPTGLQKTIAPALPPQKKTASDSNGKLLYMQKCASCHGQKAEKTALGKSQVIAGWEAAKIEAALNGYKDGTYGGAMKGLMAGQVGILDAGQIKALSAYISTL
jgi:cytochrome c553